MKNILSKRIISGILIITMISSVIGLSFPKKSQAIFGIGDITFDPTSFAQHVINTANTTATSFSSYSMQFKEYVLDGLATALVKQIIRQMTASVVNWINSGFEGSPSFVTNPGSFFLDVADQITGDFLAKAGGPLTALCSPFSIDIRIALAFKYHPNVLKKYECTLGKIITNSKNAVKGASINGFTAGDFSQGGWPAFVSLTTEPQNNYIGAYLIAEDELSIRVANAQLQQKDEISQGRGFLSWRKCRKTGETATVQGSESAYVDHELGDNSDPSRTESNAPVVHTNQTGKDCEIQTPGSIIVSSLEANINGPLHELQLADEINEIVNALFAQLVTQVLTKGLGSLSGSGPSDSSSYIYQIQQEAKNDTSQVAPIKAEILKNMTTYLDNTLQYKNNKNQSLNLMLDVKNSYELAKSCYAGKISSSNPPLSSSQASFAQSKITEIDSIINTKVAPPATKLLTEAQEADARYATLKKIETDVNAAKTTNDLNIPSQQYSQMIQNRTLTSASDIANSQQELDDTKIVIDPMKTDAGRKLQECQLFPSGSI